MKARLAVLGAAIGGVIALACFSERGAGPGPSSAAECSVPVSVIDSMHFIVAIENFAFQPDSISVPPGATVTWVNCEPSGTEPHTTTADGGGYEESTSHPRDMATQVAWVNYRFTVQHDGLERPRDFFPKSIIVEAVDGPFVFDAVRVSLWADWDFMMAPLIVASSDPMKIDRFKDPNGVPASYQPARWVIDNLFRIVVEEANKLIPFARAVAERRE